jgi:hypothetical protein
MSYGEKFDTSGAAKLRRTRWATQDSLEDILDKLSNIKFSYQEERNKISELTNDFRNSGDKKIFAKTTRFPDDDYVPLMCNEILEALKQIELAGDYRPPDVSSTNKDLTVKSLAYSKDSEGGGKQRKNGDGDDKEKDSQQITSIAERDRLEKSDKAFREALRELYKSVVDCSLNRATFENKFMLNWT